MAGRHVERHRPSALSSERHVEAVKPPAADASSVGAQRSPLASTGQLPTPSWLFCASGTVEEGMHVPFPVQHVGNTTGGSFGPVSHDWLHAPVFIPVNG